MAVSAVGTPRDDDVRPHPAKPAHDVADHPLLFDTGEPTVGVLEARDARDAHAPSGLSQLERACRADVLARDDRRAFSAWPALLAFGETQAVHAHALARVLDERAASAERLIIGMREDRRENERHAADDSHEARRMLARSMSGTARIVVVEDDKSVAELVTLCLRNAGYLVEHAPTGARARQLFDEVKPALVVLDLGLPDADGFDL